MNVETIRQYIKARESFAQGNVQEAYDQLVEGLPRKPRDNYLRDNLHRLMDVDTPAGMALLELVAKEAANQKEP